MRQRLIGAAVLVPVVVIVFIVGQPWLTFGIAALAALAAYETARLLRAADLPTDIWLPVVVAPIAVIGLQFVIFSYFPAPTDFEVEHTVGFVALVLVVAMVLGLRRLDPRVGLRTAVGNVVGSLYPSLLAFTPGLLVVAPFVPDTAPLGRVLDDGRIWLLILVLTVWSLDTFAYVAGRYHGRGRFMNHISPNKTWSGAVGGTLAAIVVCSVLLWAAGQNVLLGPGLGLLLAVTAQMGDLVESMIKRAAGAKDSGSLLPGHGGLLDRVDSFLFAGPAMFIALIYIRDLPR
jgi:phosphatidate cytidylyltransferase